MPTRTAGPIAVHGGGGLEQQRRRAPTPTFADVVGSLGRRVRERINELASAARVQGRRPRPGCHSLEPGRKLRRRVGPVAPGRWSPDRASTVATSSSFCPAPVRACYLSCTVNSLLSGEFVFPPNPLPFLPCISMFLRLPAPVCAAPPPGPARTKRGMVGTSVQKPSAWASKPPPPRSVSGSGLPLLR